MCTACALCVKRVQTGGQRVEQGKARVLNRPPFRAIPGALTPRGQAGFVLRTHHQDEPPRQRLHAPQLPAGPPPGRAADPARHRRAEQGRQSGQRPGDQLPAPVCGGSGVRGHAGEFGGGGKWVGLSGGIAYVTCN